MSRDNHTHITAGSAGIQFNYGSISAICASCTGDKSKWVAFMLRCKNGYRDVTITPTQINVGPFRKDAKPRSRK